VTACVPAAVTDLLSTSVSVISSLALFARNFEYLDLPVEVDEPARPVSVDLAQVTGHVRLDHFSFTYPGADHLALAGIDLDIRADSTLAVVGETGSGKTTLGSLVARLYDPSRGIVRIDGTDLRDMRLADLAAIVGVVSQETYLLRTTVRENLRCAIARTLPCSSSTRPPAPGHRNRAGRPAGVRHPGPRPHDHHHRAPPVHQPQRRPDYRAGRHRVRFAWRPGGKKPGGWRR
jgi:hypothetical protein